MFFDTDSFEVTEEAYTLELIAARLRGETAQFDICDKKGVAIVEEGSRITARHIREMEKAGLTRLNCPPGYVCGHVLAKDLIDSESGEVVVAEEDGKLLLPNVLVQLLEAVVRELVGRCGEPLLGNERVRHACR